MDTYAERNIEKAVREMIGFDVKNLIDALANQLEPEDIFPESALNWWAEHNGYVKEELLEKVED